MPIAENFQTFCGNLSINADIRSTISKRYKAITQRLNKDYWDSDSDTMFSRYIGSYGRDTAINNFSDLDMVFILPSSVYTRFNNYVYNGQSALLQEVKSSIEKTYPSTKLSADGIIIRVEFSDNLNFEVIPVFEQNDKSFKHAVSSEGGSWKIFDPLKEMTAINDVDST